MFRNFIKTAFRNLWRNKGFTAINIAGLAIGIATCLLIMIFVQNQLSYDRYNDKSDRIFRVVFRGSMQGGEIREASVMPPVAAAIKADYPAVEDATRIRTYGTPGLKYGEKILRDNKFAFVDENFFSIFTLPLVFGNTKTALTAPNSIVITRSVAEKFFGKENPLGKILIYTDNNNPLTVTGMIEEVPENSHFHFGIFASFNTIEESRSTSWMESGSFTYLLLKKNQDHRKLAASLNVLVDKYMGKHLQQGMGVSLEQFRKSGNQLGFGLQALTDIHLHSDMTGEIEANGDIRYVYIFTAVAIFMLLIACINFMNLSTAGSSKRSKEVGVRKVMGSGKGQLIWQFMMESLLLTAISMLLALVIVYMALPFFNTLASQHLTLNIWSNPYVIPVLILFGLLTGLLAGSYPAFFLSSFNPITVLKGKLTTSRKTSGFRSGLVVFQFFISITLIVGTIVVYNQLSYIQNKKLGFEKDQVLVIEQTGWLGKNKDAFRQNLLQDPRILSASASNYLPAGSSYGNNYMAYPDNNSAAMVKSLRYEVDYDYLSTLGITILQGRGFSADYGSDSTGIILNETAARAHGFNQDAIGHSLSHTENEGNVKTYQVIGVVKDFHFRSLRERITPLVMTLEKDANSLIIKTKSKDIAGLLATAEKKWTALKPASAFAYSFLDERFSETYKTEKNIGNILGVFAGLTIFVACLGLFGLATFTAEQRRKEIGVRKVLGADVSGLVALLSKDFLKLVIISILIALPVAWFLMDKWLQDFEYRTSIHWSVFAITSLLAIIITLATVSVQAVRAAVANPVKSLKNE